MEFSGGSLWRGFLEGVCGGGLSGRLWRSFEEVSGGGFWRGFSGHLWRGSFEEVSKGGFWRGVLGTSLEGVFQGGLWRRYLEGDVFFILFNTRFPLGLFAIKEINSFVSLLIIFQRIIWLQTRHKRIVLGIKTWFKSKKFLKRLCLPKSDLDGKAGQIHLGSVFCSGFDDKWWTAILIMKHFFRFSEILHLYLCS